MRLPESSEPSVSEPSTPETRGDAGHVGLVPLWEESQRLCGTGDRGSVGGSVAGWPDGLEKRSNHRRLALLVDQPQPMKPQTIGTIKACMTNHGPIHFPS